MEPNTAKSVVLSEITPLTRGTSSSLASSGQSLKSYKEMLQPTPGDVSCFFALFMNNLGTVLATAALGRMVLLKPFGGLEPKRHEDLRREVDTIVFGKIIPGMIPTILAGCVYYAWMTMRILRQKPEGTSMTALPYGVNTPASMMFIFAIMAPACEDNFNIKKYDPEKAVKRAVAAGVVANFIGGVVSMLFAAVGPALVQVTPPAALMIALAGIGFTWLGIAPLLDCIEFSMCGTVMIVLGLLLQLGVVKLRGTPPAVILLVTGTILGWCSGHPWQDGGTSEQLKAALGETFFGNVRNFYFPSIIDPDTFSVFGDVISTHLDVILPVAFTGAVGTLLNVKAAEKEGDAYPLRETLLIDGATTCISAMFGSPYGTCVFIGHPQFKQMGGSVAYPVLFGIVFAMMAATGACGLIAALVPPYAFQPIILMIGLFIVSDAVATAPKRHLPGCVLGLFPAVAEFIVSSGWMADDEGSSKWIALQALAKGALVLSILWTCITVCIIDAKFFHGAVWCLGGAALSSVGMIHQAALDLSFKKFTESTLYKAHIGTRPVDFVLGYVLSALIFLCLWAAQQFAPQLGLVPPPVEEKTEDVENRVQDDPEEELRRIMLISNKLRGHKHLKHESFSHRNSV